MTEEFASRHLEQEKMMRHSSSHLRDTSGAQYPIPTLARSSHIHREWQLVVIVFIVSIVLFSEFAVAQARPDPPGSESTIYLAPAKLERTQVYDNTASGIESWILPGLGFLYTSNFTEHFAYESQFEVSGWNNIFLCAVTGNFVGSFATGEGRPIVFLEGGYGINFPAIFTSELVRLDVGTIHLASGVKFPIGTDELLRISIDYKRFRIYTNSSGYDHSTYRFIGLHIGYGIVYHEDSDVE